VAQKAGLTRAQNLSSFSLPAFQQFVDGQKKKRKEKIHPCANGN
jgi:hypothetical protein